MKKIAILLNDLGMGGAERCAVLVAQAFARRGHTVSLVMLRDSRNFWGEMPPGVTVIDVSTDFKHKRLWRWWEALGRIADSHDVLIAGNILVPTYVMYFLGRNRACQTIAWVHGPIADIDALTPLSLLHRTIGRWIYRQLRRVVFVSEHARDSMADWLGTVAKPGWQVIHNFVAPLDMPAQGRHLHTPVRLLFVGRVSAEKSPLLLVETVARLNRANIAAELTIVGDGEAMPDVMRAIRQHHLEARIHWAGTQHEVQPYLDAADFLLLTSRFEGCPLVVLEAMQSALPVISTRAGGVPELLGPLSQALVVDGHDAGLLSKAIMNALPDYPALSRSMWERSRMFTEGKIMSAWNALVEVSHA